MTTKKEDPALSRCGAVAERVEIRSVRMVKSEVSWTGDLAKLPNVVSIEVHAEPRARKKDGILDVLCSFSFDSRFSEDEAEPAPLSVSAVFLLEYGVTEFRGLRKPQFAAFAELNGVYNAWPYWREYLQSTLVRMGAPPFILPVFQPTRHGLRSGPSVASKKAVKKSPVKKGARKRAVKR